MDTSNTRTLTPIAQSYTLAGAKVVASALASVAASGRFSQLDTVDIADVIAGRPEEEALEVLRTICAPLKESKSLTAIDVSDNAFGAKGLDACVDLLEGQTKLTSLKAQVMEWVVGGWCAYKPSFQK